MAEPDLRARWQEPRSGVRYATARWRSLRARERDPRLVDAVLRSFLPFGRRSLVLDAPCGAGRLRAAVERHGRWLGLDVSASMLGAARETGPPSSGSSLLLGDVEHLPFRAGSFDAVVCCRLLHHLRDGRALERALRELVRVARGLVIASFWDAAALPEWKRRAFHAAAAGRVARPRSDIARSLAAAGAEVLAWRHSLRFVSRQAFVVARKRAGRP